MTSYGAFIDPWSESKPSTLHYSSASQTSGSSTTAFDSFRQGVELSQEKYFYNSAAKIHAGYPNHTPPQTYFGQTRPQITNEQWYAEIDTFDPIKFINLRQELATFSTGAAIRVYDGTFPLISSNENISSADVMDGVLEPLSIRPRAYFFSVEAPFEAHDIKANLQMGNIDNENYNNIVSDEIDFSQFPGTNSFLDSTDGIGGIQQPGGYLPEKMKLSPFADTRLSSSIRYTLNMDSSIKNAINKLASIADGYLSDNFKKAASGFTYDTAAGTDSVVFGDMLYMSSTVSLPP